MVRSMRLMRRDRAVVMSSGSSSGLPWQVAQQIRQVIEHAIEEERLLSKMTCVAKHLGELRRARSERFADCESSN